MMDSVMKKEAPIMGILMVLSLILAGVFLFWGLDSNNYQFFLSRRVPRILGMLLTGGGIGYASVIFQTITHNRILTPGVMGLDALYLFIQSGALFLFGSQSALLLDPRINFFLTLGMMSLLTAVVFPLLLKKQGRNLFQLLLMGIILGTFFRSLSSFMQMVMDPNEFSVVQNRMFASFNSVNQELLMISGILFILMMIGAYRLNPYLDVMSLGRDQAINLGVPYDQAVQGALVLIGGFVAVSTALIGPITFLGIIVANLSRQLLRTYQHRKILPAAVLLGFISLLGGQLFVERILGGGVPVSLVINFIGGLYFIRILLKEGKVQ